MKHVALACALLAMALLAGNAVAQERATVIKPDDIRVEPFSDARSVGALKKGEVVALVRKQGAWVEVRAGAVSGWVRALSLRMGASAADAASELASLPTGRVVTGEIVAATGVRGTDTASPGSVPAAEAGEPPAGPAGQTTLQGLGYGASVEEARQRAAADLVAGIQVRVQSVVESCVQVQGRKAEDCGSRVLKRTAADLPMLGLRYVPIPGEGERYGAKALLDARDALPLYRQRLEQLRREVQASAEAVRASQDATQRLNALLRQLAALRAMADHRLVAVALGDAPAELPGTESALGAEIEVLTRTADSIGFAARLLLRELPGRLVNVEPVMPAGAAEVTEFGSALQKALYAEGAGGEGPALTARGEYRVLDNGYLDASLELRRLPEGEVAAVRIVRLLPAAYAGYRTAPLAPDVDRLLREGVAVSAQLRVDVMTDRGTRSLLFRGGESVRLLVRANQAGYFYVVGNVVREAEQFSYLMPLDGVQGGPVQAERFIRYLPPDKVNHYVEIGEFGVEPPYGTEHLQVIMSSRRPEGALPAARYIPASGYFEIVNSRGAVAATLGITRGLKAKGGDREAVAEGVLSFTTVER